MTATNDAIELQLGDALEKGQHRLVVAESCTAGRVAARVAIVPGISAYFCGGWAVYRNASKAGWLGISDALLDGPGPVSQEVSDALAEAALQHTPEADVAFAITGDVGPGAPPERDGLVFLALCERGGPMVGSSCKLSFPTPRDEYDLEARNARLQEASEIAIRFMIEHLS